MCSFFFFFEPNSLLDSCTHTRNNVRYNAVFQLLFVIARVQISLRRAWLPQVKQKSRQQEFQQNWAPFWRLRNRMAHFIDALQFHLQVDVIESEFTILVEKMKGCDDFELIKKYHDEFIQNVVVQSRVENRVMSTINSIFQLCLNFCDILSQPRPLDLIDKAMELAVRYDTQFNFLHAALSQSQAMAPLALRIDYNEYYTRRKQGGIFDSVRSSSVRSSTLSLPAGGGVL
eukprot:TRINITY_DN5471_c0_g1_i6.p1 TRINITY_DN5471_c0_g1~~TRINITY_DN5471_c0_g1_i6.p1  ORF type:complete len:230 (-),score=23.83 TRINITY_DN5471_c0_g1_i6:22-711(-)